MTVEDRSIFSPTHALATEAPPRPGLHLMANLHECSCRPGLMVHMPSLQSICTDLVRRAGLTSLGHYFHGFDGRGISGTIIVSESHVSVHTWPDARYVSLDVYVANYSDDNRAKARRLFDGLVELFAPLAPRTFAIDRG